MCPYRQRLLARLDQNQLGVLARDNRQAPLVGHRKAVAYDKAIAVHFDDSSRRCDPDKLPNSTTMSADAKYDLGP